jgi:hydrogenase expression/formation protein HypE
MEDKRILMGHGSGGRLSRELIMDIFVRCFSNKKLDTLGDAALVELHGENLAFTTDSYVIDPVFFPGGDIGQLAVSGTVNDLAVSGALPKYLTAGFIIEEGFSVGDLEKIAASMAREAGKAGILIVAGDTKVVKRGQCDKIFINTSGIGIIPEDRLHIGNATSITPGDKLILSGSLGDHSVAVLAARENLELDETILSDAAPLNHMVEAACKDPSYIHAMRDITRGGLATILVEICEKGDFGIIIDEHRLPVRKSVRSVCELFGFDPLYLANEGKILFVVKAGQEKRVLDRITSVPEGKQATLIGEITGDPGKVIMRSVIGGNRIIDMLSGEMLPRIC